MTAPTVRIIIFLHLNLSLLSGSSGGAGRDGPKGFLGNCTAGGPGTKGDTGPRGPQGLLGTVGPQYRVLWTEKIDKEETLWAKNIYQCQQNAIEKAI